MSAPRDPSPQPIHMSITTYKQSTPQSQALRRRNIIVPPLYFGMVAPKIYRRFPPLSATPSGHPLQLNFPFLERLKLKTIMYVGCCADGLMVDTLLTRSIRWRILSGARNMGFRYVIFGCSLRRSHLLRMILLWWRRRYRIFSIHGIIRFLFTVIRGNIDGCQHFAGSC